jgi:hypothetical protein
MAIAKNDKANAELAEIEAEMKVLEDRRVLVKERADGEFVTKSEIARLLAAIETLKKVTRATNDKVCEVAGWSGSVLGFVSVPNTNVDEDSSCFGPSYDKFSMPKNTRSTCLNTHEIKKP